MTNTTLTAHQQNVYQLREQALQALEAIIKANQDYYKGTNPIINEINQTHQEALNLIKQI